MSNKLPKQKHHNKRVCVFCKSSPITKVHMFPYWFKTILLKNSIANNHIKHRGKLTDDSRGTGSTLYSVLKSGHVFSNKLRIACKNCSNGWMNNLQSDAKPILSELILGRDALTTESNRSLFCKWIVMTTMIGEFDHLETKQVPSSQLISFKETQQIPNGWKIWIANYEGSLEFRYRHGGLSYVELFNSLDELHRLQTTMFVLGRMFVYVMSTTSAHSLRLFGNEYLEKLEELWPSKKTSFFGQSKSVTFSHLYTIRDEEIHELINLHPLPI